MKFKTLFGFYLIFLFFLPYSFAENLPYCSYFGEYSYHGTIDVASGPSEYHYSVGKFCSIGDCLKINLDGNHRVDWISTYPFPAFTNKFPEARGIQGYVSGRGDVTIGNDVWIGEHVTIMSGVTIGDGAVIGANSVVGKSIPPYAVAVGNSARVVRYRFDEKTIDLLLKIQWWNWPIERITSHCRLLCSADVQEFLNICENINATSACQWMQPQSRTGG